MPVRALVVALVTLVALVIAVPAQAVISCTYDAPTATVTVSLDNGDVAAVSRSGDAIAVNGQACDIATVSNTDTINVSSTGTAAELDIDLSGGAFAPGKTPETDAADSEIEWLVTLQSGSKLKVLGSANADDVVVGQGGINLNATEATGDVDVVVNGGPAIELDGNDGDDTLSTAGGAGTGTAGPVATLAGGAGNDTLEPGTPGSTLDGGDGSDTADYSGTTGPIDADLTAGTVAVGDVSDTLTAIENVTGTPADDTIVGDAGPNAIDGGAGDDAVDGGAGDDALDGGDGSDSLTFAGATSVRISLATGKAIGDGNDTVDAFENVTGTDGNDRLFGDDADNALDGGDGNDVLNGGKGDDDLKGGAGTDTINYAGLKASVTIDLRDGSSTGAGDDTLSGFESVVGSNKADEIDGDGRRNTLDGGAGADKISGHGGNDRVIGSKGNDLLSGQKGDDSLIGGAGNDQLDGGKGTKDVCRGGDGADAFVDCDNLPTSLMGSWVIERVGSTLR